MRGGSVWRKRSSASARRSHPPCDPLSKRPCNSRLAAASPRMISSLRVGAFLRVGPRCPPPLPPQLGGYTVQNTLHPRHVPFHAKVDHGESRRAVQQDRLLVNLEPAPLGAQRFDNGAELFRGDDDVRSRRPIGRHRQWGVGCRGCHNSCAFKSLPRPEVGGSLYRNWVWMASSLGSMRLGSRERSRNPLASLSGLAPAAILPYEEARCGIAKHRCMIEIVHTGPKAESH